MPFHFAETTLGNDLSKDLVRLSQVQSLCNILCGSSSSTAEVWAGFGALCLISIIVAQFIKWFIAWDICCNVCFVRSWLSCVLSQLSLRKEESSVSLYLPLGRTEMPIGELLELQKGMGALLSAISREETQWRSVPSFKAELARHRWVGLAHYRQFELGILPWHLINLQMSNRMFSQQHRSTASLLEDNKDCTMDFS